MPASVNAILGSRGLPKGGRPRHVSTVSSRGGKKRVLTYQGTPVSREGIALSKAPSRAVQVQKALERVQKAYGKTRAVSGLDPEQQSVLSTVLRQGEKAGATKREKLAAVETGLVESGMRNLSYGDADSQGWRQERTSQYGTGPQGARNVKASARRFFQEIKTEGAGAPTPGLAAQGAQGSAFPERYDEQEAKARQLLRASQIKPKEKDVKTLAKAGIDAKKPSSPSAHVKKKPGQWAGSQKAVLSVVPKNVRAEGRGDKRTPEENAAVGGAEDSDHLTTNKKSYAADLPPDDNVAKQIASRLGLSSHTGTNEVVKNGYRYQLIWQDSSHYDHIHLGAEWVGKGIPPGTTLGGSSDGGSTGSTSSGSSPGGGGTLGPKETEKGLTPREKLARVRSKYGEGTTETASDISSLRRKYKGAVV